MTDDTSDKRPLSQSRLGDYARCPRYYEFNHDWEVETPDDTIRYRRRGTALHGVIEDTWLRLHPDIDHESIGENDPNPIVEPMGTLPWEQSAVQEYALDAFDDRWDTHVPLDAYRTRSHFDYDRRTCREAIHRYFAADGPGCDHLRTALGSEIRLAFEYQGLYLHGLLDLVRRTNEGIHVIDFKSSLNGIISTHNYWGPKTIEDHQSGESHNPRKIKSLMQAAVYRRAARHLDVHTDDMAVAFSFYGLRDDVEALPNATGVVPDVTAAERSMADFLDEHHDEAWGFIQQYATGIRDEAYAPEPWERIYESQCDDCPYREMCPDYLSQEVTRLE